MGGVNSSVPTIVVFSNLIRKNIFHKYIFPERIRDVQIDSRGNRAKRLAWNKKAKKKYLLFKNLKFLYIVH